MRDLALAVTIVGVAWAIAWARVQRLRIEGNLAVLSESRRNHDHNCNSISPGT